ncbi:MAG: 4Fe-4S binding protein [Bacteroidales bacterium]
MNIIYFSPTHTSALVAESIAKGMGATELNILDFTYTDISESPLKEGPVIIAAPVYAGRIAKTAMARFASLKGNGNLAVVVAVYGNRHYEDALIELYDFANAAGFNTIAASAFIGEHSYSRPEMPTAAGRPDHTDLKIAFEFGESIRKKIESGNLNAPQSIPGNRPYTEKGPATPATPITSEELCTQCGTCIDYCPTQAISLKDEIESDIELCIKCCACVKICPNEARIFNTPYTELLHKNFSRRREPEMCI